MLLIHFGLHLANTNVDKIYIYMVCITKQDYNSTIAPFASIPNDVVIASL